VGQKDVHAQDFDLLEAPEVFELTLESPNHRDTPWQRRSEFEARLTLDVGIFSEPGQALPNGQSTAFAACAYSAHHHL
jgi:hypothetical protein